MPSEHASGRIASFRPAAAHARRTFHVSLLLACVISGPLAAVIVFVLWANTGSQRLPDGAGTPAMWSARTFMMAFDILLVSTWPLAALVAARLRRTSRPHV